MTSTMSILVAKRIPRAISRTRAIDPAPRGFTRSGSVKNPIHRKRLSKLYQSTNIIPKWLGDNDFLFRTDIESALAERSEEHTSELQSLMRISYVVFCLKKKTNKVCRSCDMYKYY